ncbi:MAG: ABC transporter permease, partial [Chloroflexota bacterium]|nr:ABC transporter permease [Chloroflexota bacterium]
RIVSSLAFPLAFLVIFGAGFGRVIGSLAPGVDFMQFIYPGIVAMTVLTSSLFAGVSVVWDREFGFLREILVAPIGRTGIVLGKAAGATLIALLQVAIILLLAPLVGVALNPTILLGLLPMVVILSLGLSALGLIIGLFMTSQHGFQLVIQLLIFPLIFLAGVFFPVDQVPLWMEIISKLNPLTYGVDTIRQIFLGSEAGLGVTVLGHTMTLLQEAVLISAMTILLLAGAVVAFNRQE